MGPLAVRPAAVLAGLSEPGSELEHVLALLRACSQDAPEMLAVAEGDRRLLALHRALTGRDVALTVTCGGCSAENELTVTDVPEEAPRVAVCGAGGGVRAPTYGDLLDLPEDLELAEAELLRRCVVGAPARAPRPEDLELIDDSLAGPLVSACVECGARLEVALDIEQLVVAGLRQQLERIDAEVHLLARAYHWDLATIERLPDERRTRLAELVAEGR